VGALHRVVVGCIMRCLTSGCAHARRHPLIRHLRAANEAGPPVASSTRSSVSLEHEPTLKPTRKRVPPAPACSSVAPKKYCDNNSCTSSQRLWLPKKSTPRGTPDTRTWIVVDQQHVSETKTAGGADWSEHIGKTVCRDCGLYFEYFGKLPEVPYPFTAGCKVLVNYGEEFGECGGEITNAEPDKDGWLIRVPGSHGHEGETFRCDACKPFSSDRKLFSSD